MNSELLQEIYQYYYDTSIYIKTGKHPRKIVNWVEIRKKESWPYFEKFAERVNKSNGQINYKIYISALFDFSKGKWFSPKLLTSPKGIAIYKSFITQKNQESDPELVKKSIKESMKYIIKFCKKQGIESFSDYFFNNANTYPTIILHYNAGSISKAFFSLIPNIEKKLGNFPRDIVEDTFPKQKIIELKTSRISNITLSKEIEEIALNLEDIINHYLNKEK